MKRGFIFVLAAAALLAFAMAGCGSSAEKGVTTQESTTSAKAEQEETTRADTGETQTTSIQAEGTQEPVSSLGESESSAPEASQAKEGFPVSVTDMLGNKVKLEKKPEKIAVISAGLLELFHSAKGVSICAPDPEEGKEEAAFSKDLPKIGKASNPDIIAILELEPDLVIAEAGVQNEVISILRKNDIVVIALKSDGGENSEKSLALMKKAAGIEEK